MRIVKLTPDAIEGILENMLKRSPSSYGEYESAVADILDNVRKNGDKAVFEYT